MPRCEFCRAFFLTQEQVQVEFQPNLAVLKQNAEHGCDFCLLCWTGFQRTWSASTIDSILNGMAPEHVQNFDPTLWLDLTFQGAWPVNFQPEIRVSCGFEAGRLSSIGLETIDLDIFAKEGTPTRSLVPGRMFTVDHEPNGYLPWIKRFLHGCMISHPDCTVEGRVDMPTRLIDVGNPQNGTCPRLVITTSDMQEKYLALSYCWGPATDTFTLNSQTFQGMVSGIDESRLVAAHRDTLHLARLLDIQFVWIDALCIIQGDSKDWEHESKRMGRVYGNATLTIVAGRSADARDSFLANNYKRAVPACELPLHEAHLGSVSVDLRRSRDFGASETRGWCLQEKYLSRRLVIFGKEQIYLSCYQRHYAEGGYDWFDPGRDALHDPASLHTSFQTVLRAATGDLESRRAVLFRHWDAILGDFSRRQLSNPHDIFAGIASMAATFSQAVDSRYLAGVWECDLVRSLLWMPGYLWVGRRFPPLTRPQPTRFAPSSVVRAPTWSWAAVQGAVYNTPRDSFQNQIARAKKTSKQPIKVRPRLQDLDRWSADTSCGVSTLHMPNCELQLLGRVVQGIVLPDSPTLEFVKALRKRRQIHPVMSRHVRLMITKGSDRKAVESDPTLVAALGAFDIPEESTEEVWCLQLATEALGLILRRGGDGKFQRLGLFQLYKSDWFDDVDETDISLV